MLFSFAEQACILNEFEEQFLVLEETDISQHEQGMSFQEKFKKPVYSLYNTIHAMGNPFTLDCPELLVLDNHNCARDGVITTVCSVEQLGQVKYQDYVQTVITKRTASVHQPIKRNNLALFKSKAPSLSKGKQQIKNLQSDCNLFSQLYIASTYVTETLWNVSSIKTFPGHHLCLLKGTCTCLQRSLTFSIS